MGSARKDNLVRRQYLGSGYYIARGVFQPERVRGIVNNIKRLFFNQMLIHGGDITSGLREAMAHLLRTDRQAYVATLTACARLIEVQDFLLDPAIRRYIWRVTHGNQFLSHPPVLNVMCPDLKIEGGYYGTVAHQDWPSLQGSLDAVVVWVPLGDADAGNFPLQVIPGSHKRGLLRGSPKGSVREIYHVDESQFESLRVFAGDVVFMSAFTVHRTGMQGDLSAFRMSLSTRYENTSEPTFIERGHPSAQKRITQYGTLPENFPSTNHIEQVFGDE